MFLHSEKKIRQSVTKSILKSIDTQTTHPVQQNFNVEDKRQNLSISNANTVTSNLSIFGSIAELDSLGGISSDSLTVDLLNTPMSGVSSVNYMDSEYSHAHYRIKKDSIITDTRTYQIPNNYIANDKSKENSENISEFVSRTEAIGGTAKVEDMQDTKVLKNQAREVISTKHVNENSSTACSNSEKAVQTTIPDNTAGNNVNVCCSTDEMSSCVRINGSCMRDSENVEPFTKSLEAMVENAIVEGTTEIDCEKSKCMEELLDEIVYRIYGITEKAITEGGNNEDVDNTNNIISDTIKRDLKDENKKENLNDVEKKPFTKLNGNESNNGGITAALSKDDLCTADKAIKSIHIRNRTDINLCDTSKPRSCCQVFKEDVVKKIYDNRDISSADETCCCSSSETIKREPKDTKCCFCYSGNKQKKYKPTNRSEKNEEENIIKNRTCLYNNIFVGFIDGELSNMNPRIFCSCSNISVDSIEEDTHH